MRLALFSCVLGFKIFFRFDQLYTFLRKTFSAKNSLKVFDQILHILLIKEKYEITFS